MSLLGATLAALCSCEPAARQPGPRSTGPAQAVGEPAGPGAGEIERLIEQLGSESFEDRQKASKRLEEIGEQALPALEKAAGSRDAEVRRRAGELAKLLKDRIGDREARKIIVWGVKALGGEERLSRYKGVKIKGKMTEYSKGQRISTYILEIIRRYPFQNQSILESVRSGSTQRFVWNGHKGWLKHDDGPVDYSRDIVEGFRDLAHAEAVASLTPLLSDKAYTLSLVGGAKAEGIDVIGVLVSHRDHRAVKLFFDKRTGLVVKYEASTEEFGKEAAWETILSDYRDIGGITRPGKATIKDNDGEVWRVFKFTEYEALEDVDESMFAEP
jgi:hypothetical protein